MASIQKRKNAYTLVAYQGYNAMGKQIRKTKTWKIPAGMSAKKAEKEALKAAVLFEQQLQAGLLSAEHGIKLSDFAQRWFSDYAAAQCKIRTVSRYRDLYKRIDVALGHFYIDKIQPAHIMAFYKQLQTVPACDKMHCIVPDFKAMLADRGLTKKALAEQAGISIGTLNSVTQGKNIAIDSAEKIAAALNMPTEQLFKAAGGGKCLAPKTVHEYHVLLSDMLETAVKWQIIVANPCRRVQPPKVTRSEVLVLDREQAIQLLELLENQPPKYRVAVTVLLFTGMRRGELLALNWSDIDFDKGTISISKNLLYERKRGLFVDSTKTASSNRVIAIPNAIVECLRQYRNEQRKEFMRLGAGWSEDKMIFSSPDGKPMHPDTLSGWFREFIKKTDLPQIHLHALRHTNATLNLANGIAVTTVSGQLGHSTPATTMKIYAHALKSEEARAADSLETLLIGSQA